MHADVKDPHRLLLGIHVIGEKIRKPMFVFDWDGVDPVYKLEITSRRGATVTIKEFGRSQKKAIVRLSMLPFHPSKLPTRMAVVHNDPADAAPPTNA